MFSLIVFFRPGAGGGARAVGEFFRILWKKGTFGGKMSGELSERDSTFPERLFEGRRVFPKNFHWITSSNIQPSFSFLSFFVMFIKKASLCPDELFGEIFLWLNNYLRIFSEIEQNIVVFCQQYCNRFLSNLRFICLGYVFRGDFFTWKLISSWITSSRNRAIYFRKT